MTRHTNASPLWAHRITMAMSAAVTALVLTACGDAQPEQTAPSSSALPVGATPGPSAAPAANPHTVFGNLSVLFALTTADSEVPDPPLSYALFVSPPGSTVATLHPVDPDGTFALALPPGTYQVTHVEIKAADFGSEPVNLPLKAAESLVVRVPATGCLYGGEVNVVYGRLPAGSEQKQGELVARAAENNKEDYSFVYRPDGGFVLAGASVTMPGETERPAAAHSCVAEKFSWVTT